MKVFFFFLLNVSWVMFCGVYFMIILLILNIILWIVIIFFYLFSEGKSLVNLVVYYWLCVYKVILCR